MATLNVFCASGGGSKGAFQGGVLEALTAAGIELHGLVGVSTGAIQAGFTSLAAPGLDAQRAQVGLLRDLWTSIDRADAVYRAPLFGTLGLAWALLRKQPSLYSLEPFERLLETHVRSAPARPVRLGTVDLESGQFRAEAPADAAALRRAIRASAAIPLLFSPVAPASVDGSVRDVAPVKLAFDLAADIQRAQLGRFDGVRIFVALAFPRAVAADARPWAEADLLAIGGRALWILEAENYAWDVEGALRVNWLVTFFKQHPDLTPPPFLAGKIAGEILVIEPERDPYPGLTFDPAQMRAFWDHGRARAEAVIQGSRT
jgi:predicted acylesterase/phospholipase RssA